MPNEEMVTHHLPQGTEVTIVGPYTSVKATTTQDQWDWFARRLLGPRNGSEERTFKMLTGICEVLETHIHTIRIGFTDGPGIKLSREDALELAGQIIEMTVEG